MKNDEKARKKTMNNGENRETTMKNDEKRGNNNEQ